MFLLDKTDELNTLTLGKIISTFMTRDVPRLNRYHDYYKGKMKIWYKVPSDDGRPCNKTCVNFCRVAVNTFNGYITGNDITYSNDDADISAVLDVLDYNDVHQTDSEYLRNALIYGRAVELNYVDEEGKQRFRLIDPRSAIDVYDNTLEHNLIYGIRFWRADFSDLVVEDQYYVDVYDEQKVHHYKSTSGFSSFILLSEEQHYYNQVPMTFFSLDAAQLISSYE